MLLARAAHAHCRSKWPTAVLTFCPADSQEVAHFRSALDTVWGREIATGVFVDKAPCWFKRFVAKHFKMLCNVERFRLSDQELEALASRYAPLRARARARPCAYAICAVRGHGDERKPH